MIVPFIGLLILVAIVRLRLSGGGSGAGRGAPPAWVGAAVSDG
jgi:hypothetical protein